ncbi:hypothetical protein [Hymenobacter coccineus]|uniref:STAS/SEC14 domain-containing protein n=1 Tax=Hymenobacter coccineus TaxID=1908235 RepID=A0A1G1TH71_9BACT|nr:hypothetical protein [Hymenobacter coccineus]OGX90228.1 hypothetical protein BEN49_07195 [Hymenobacter coccineus]
MAARSVYFENAAGRVWEEPQHYLRLDYYAGPREEVAFRALLTHALRAMTRRGWGKLLIDQRKMAPYSDAERAWMVEEWLPRAIREGGYRYGAVVLAENAFARVSMTRLAMASRELGNTYKTFDTEDEAMGWLTQVGVAAR